MSDELWQELAKKMWALKLGRAESFLLPLGRKRSDHALKAARRLARRLDVTVDAYCRHRSLHVTKTA